jgi:hypothetical protein
MADVHATKTSNVRTACIDDSPIQMQSQLVLVSVMELGKRAVWCACGVWEITVATRLQLHLGRLLLFTEVVIVIIIGKLWSPVCVCGCSGLVSVSHLFMLYAKLA